MVAEYPRLKALGLEEGGEFNGVGFAFHGVEEAEDLEALVGAAAGYLDHPVLGLGGGDDHFVGPRDDLGGIDDAGSDAFDVIFSLGAIIHGRRNCGAGRVGAKTEKTRGPPRLTTRCSSRVFAGEEFNYRVGGGVELEKRGDGDIGNLRAVEE